MTNDASLAVAKRGGAVEPLVIEKLIRCLTIGLRACGQDVFLAGPLARAIRVHLDAWSRRRPPTSDYLFKCVQTVLREVELEDVGRVLADYRRRRAARRRGISVVKVGNGCVTASGWSKERVAEFLQSRFGLQRRTARSIADEVEQRVLSLGYWQVPASMVREVVQAEMLAWGLATATADAGRDVDSRSERGVNPSVPTAE